MVAKTVVDAKGDLIAGTAADTVNRLAVGNNGETLVADSSTSTGLRYQSAYNGNALINGAFDIWQRGTSIASGAFYPYTADRWQCVRGGVVAGMTTSRQLSGLAGFQYCARLQRDSGNTSTAGLALYNAFESVSTYPLAGQAVTFSYYARAGANYSGGALLGNVGTGTGTDQNPITSAYTGSTTAITTSATLTTSWQRFQGTATLSSAATEMFVNFQWIPTGTAGANDYVEITGVQVEMGSIATTFKRAGGTIQGELAACQRYYFRTNYSTEAVGAEAGSVFGHGFIYSSTAIYPAIQHPVVMRVKPTSMDFSNLRFEDWTGSTAPLTAATMNNTNTLMTRIVGTVSGAGANRYCQLQASTSNGYIGFSAEL
jgi:hypothetical protein